MGGYSCSDTDKHNCIQQVEYETRVCNTGTSTEIVFEWDLYLNKVEDGGFSDETVGLLPLGPGYPDNRLRSSECVFTNPDTPQNVNRCVDAQYETRVSANAVDPTSGVPKGCTSTTAIEFGWYTPTTTPTHGPTPFHNPASCSPSVAQRTNPPTPVPATRSPTLPPTSRAPVPAPPVGPTPAPHNPASCSPSADTHVVTHGRVGADNTCGEDGAISILGYICGPGNFDLTCQAFNKANQSDLLGGLTVPLKDAQLTVFSPTDAAMTAAGYTADYINSADVAQLINVMSAQILRGRFTEAELECDQHYVTILGVVWVKVECSTNPDGSITKYVGGFYNDGTNAPEIMPPKDIALCNGLVQPIRHVIAANPPL